jgi:hypothetical protein
MASSTAVALPFHARDPVIPAEKQRRVKKAARNTMCEQ